MRTIQHRFVELMPDTIEENVLYISVYYCTAIHKCVCGCGNEVVTPLSPTDWELTFDGRTISLSPSIGNWNFDCRSHYFIRKSKIVHARRWGDEGIMEERRNNDKNKKKYESNKQGKGGGKKPGINKFLIRFLKRK